MPKLPKELQKKRKEKIARVKGSSNVKGRTGTSRAMRRKLQAQGIENMEQLDCSRVIFQCPDKEIIIENPQVVQLKQQGMTIHQVIGDIIERELSINGSLEDYSKDEITGDFAETSIDEEEALENDVSSSEVKQQDIILVATQAGVTKEEAKLALEEASGDLARAILNLKTR